VGRTKKRSPPARRQRRNQLCRPGKTRKKKETYQSSTSLLPVRAWQMTMTLSLLCTGYERSAWWVEELAKKMNEPLVEFPPCAEPYGDVVEGDSALESKFGDGGDGLGGNEAGEAVASSLRGSGRRVDDHCMGRAPGERGSLLEGWLRANAPVGPLIVCQSCEMEEK
jgi:hypothetical protein